MSTQTSASRHTPSTQSTNVTESQNLEAGSTVPSQASEVLLYQSSVEHGICLQDRVLLAIKDGNEHKMEDVFTKVKTHFPVIAADADGEESHPEKDQTTTSFSVLAQVIEKLATDGKIAVKGKDPKDKLDDDSLVQLNTPEPDQRFEIDPRFKEELPQLAPGELAELERSILTEGCRQPLTVWENGDRTFLVDGYQRQEICQRHGIDYEVGSIDLPNQEAVIDWMWDNKYGQRNLTPEAESYRRGKRFNALNPGPGGDRRSPEAKSQNATLKMSAQAVADRYEVNRATIFRDGQYAQALDKIAKACGIDFRNRILSRAIRLTRANVVLLSSKSKGEMKQLKADLLDGKQLALRPAGPKNVFHLTLTKGKADDQAQIVLNKLGKAAATKLNEALSKLLKDQG